MYLLNQKELNNIATLIMRGIRIISSNFSNIDNSEPITKNTTGITYSDDSLEGYEELTYLGCYLITDYLEKHGLNMIITDYYHYKRPCISMIYGNIKYKCAINCDYRNNSFTMDVKSIIRVE